MSIIALQSSVAGKDFFIKSLFKFHVLGKVEMHWLYFGL